MDREDREFLDRKLKNPALEGRGLRLGGSVFNAINEKFAGIDEKFEETKRYFGVVAEGLRSEIRLVAEGHDVIRREIEEFREEVRNEFKEIRSLVKFSYTDMGSTNQNA